MHFFCRERSTRVDAPENQSRYAHYALGLLVLLYVINYVDRQVLAVLLEPIKQDLGVSDTAMGFLSGLAFALFYTTAGVPIARWADRGNRRDVIVFGVIVWSAMTALCGLARNFSQLAAARVGVGIGEAALNPAAHRPVIIASGTPQILLPWDNAMVFQRNFSAHNQGQLASWTAWTTPSTMSVGDVARRVGMGEAELRSANSIPPRMLVKAGSTLLVSRSSKMQADVAVNVVDNAQVSLAPEIITQRTVVKARKADTLVSLANRYGLSPASVAGWNSIKSSATFKTGQKVVVFLPIKSKAHSRSGSIRKTAKAAKTVTGVPRKAAVKTRKR